ncbi:MAG: lipid-A-disaccharide synthase [Desulfobacterales bacterium]
MKKRIFIIAGEASGDMHGANLVKALRRQSEELEIFGFGGSGMRRAGMDVILDSADLAVMGITEVLSKISTIRSGFRTAERLLRQRRPDLLILIDFPDFNLRIAAKAKKAGIPVLYYISPQIWAWRRGRVRIIGRLVDHMAVILPFEERFYRDHRVPVTFVGHPLMDDWDGSLPGTAGRSNGIKSIGLLPGSRLGEIQRHLPVLLEAAVSIQRRRPEMQFTVSRSPEIDPGIYQAMSRPYTDRLGLELDGNGARRLLGRVDLVVAASGTVVLEAALADTPAIVIYRVSPLSYLIGRLLIRVPFISLVNLIAGRLVVPELIQQESSAESIAEKVFRLIDHPSEVDRIRGGLEVVRRRLGKPGASDRVAGIALKMVAAH